MPLSPLGRSLKLIVQMAWSWFQKGERKKKKNEKLMKPEAWKVVLEKNHSITSSCGMITMIYEAEVISCDCASGRLVSHDLWSRATQAQEPPHMFNSGLESALFKGIPELCGGGGEAIAFWSMNPLLSSTSSLGGHLALLLSLSF